MDDLKSQEIYHCGNSFSGLWEKTIELSKDNLAAVERKYNSLFPFQVRLELANWIEGNLKNSINLHLESEKQKAVSFSHQLLNQLKVKIESLPNNPDKFLIKNNLSGHYETLKKSIDKNPLDLYLNLVSCLQHELKIHQETNGERIENELSLDETSSLLSQLETLKRQNTETSCELSRIHQEQEAFSVEYYGFLETRSRYDSLLRLHGDTHSDVKNLKMSRDTLEKRIRHKYFNLTNMRSALVESFIRTFHGVKEVQEIILDKELIKWKRDQQLAGNGNTMGFSLNTLQEWCEGLADIIWTIRQQVKILEGDVEKLADPTNSVNHIPKLLAGITELLSNLVTGTFIIEKQPPQVMKTNTRFTASVRLLVGRVLNVHMAAPSVFVSIVSECQANNLLSTPSNCPKQKEDYSSGDILNGQGTMEHNAAKKTVSVSFKNLQLKKIKRTEKKGTESVMDEKFSMLFWTEFLVGELKFQVWTLSLPVVVIVHGNQEPQALATVTWDNAFAEWGRRPFVVPDKVTWAQAGSALNMKWTSACGRSLTEDNLYYLACKALRNNNLPRSQNNNEFNGLELTWSQFCKETLPERSFTFWEWFYRILLLTSNYMPLLWKEGFIMGFVSKQDAESLLIRTNRSGCFLLRFSDSELGGITIGYLRCPHQASPSVFNVAPFTAKNLSQRSMADVIFDIKDLTVLYPEIPKIEFRQFCTAVNSGPSSSSNSNGYVKHMLVTQVQDYFEINYTGNINSLMNLPNEIGSPGSAHGVYGEMTNESMDTFDSSLDYDVDKILGGFDENFLNNQNHDGDSNY